MDPVTFADIVADITTAISPYAVYVSAGLVFGLVSVFLRGIKRTGR